MYELVPGDDVSSLPPGQLGFLVSRVREQRAAYYSLRINSTAAARNSGAPREKKPKTTTPKPLNKKLLAAATKLTPAEILEMARKANL